MTSRFALAFVLAVLVVATLPAVADDSGVLRYPSYGFSVVLPTPREAIGLDLGQINGMIESYKANNLAYVVFATDDIQPKNATARQALGMIAQMGAAISAQAPEMGFHVLNGSNAQAIAATGFGARVSKDMATKSGKSAMDWTTSVPAQLRAMFGDDIYQAVLIVPKTETGRMIVGVGIVGPGGQSPQIDAEVARVMQTLSIGAQPAVASASNGPGASSATASALKSLSSLKKGQIELIGIVSSLDKPGKSLVMMVSQVTSCGQAPVGLDPARQKKIFAKTIPAGVKEGSRIVVVGADSGVGKPVTADTIKVIQSDEAK